MIETLNILFASLEILILFEVRAVRLTKLSPETPEK